MIDDVPEVADLIPTGEAIAQRDDLGRLVYRLQPEGQARITAALAARGIAAREATARGDVHVIVCRPTGQHGPLSDHDRGVLEDFAAALAQPTDDRRRAALLAMSDDQEAKR